MNRLLYTHNQVNQVSLTKMPKIYSILALSDSIVNIFGFWTVDWKRKKINNGYLFQVLVVIVCA